jgi:hypothetical protein
LGEEIIVEVHAHIVSDMMIVHILVAVWLLIRSIPKHTVTKYTELWLHVMVEWSALLLPIQEVQGSNTGPQTSYPYSFLQFSCSFRHMTAQNLIFGHDHFLPHHFQFINHPIIWHYIFWTKGIIKEGKNKRIKHTEL